MSQCTATKADGSRCKTPTWKGETFCFFHHPDRDRVPSIIDFVDHELKLPASFSKWRIVLKAAWALPLTSEELEIFKFHTDREKPPSKRVSELIIISGRRSGKTRIASIISSYMASQDWSDFLVEGEDCYCYVISTKMRKGRGPMSYMKAIFKNHLNKLVESKGYLDELIRLKSGVLIEVQPSNNISVRNDTAIFACLDEVGHWHSNPWSANQGEEVVKSLKPAMLTLRGRGMIVGISSPFARQGWLWQQLDKHYGKEEDNRLIWVSDTVSMNPLVDREIIAEAFEEDPVHARSEYGEGGKIYFRADLEGYLEKEELMSITVPERYNLLPQPDIQYVGFIDPSTGKQDAFTACIAHGHEDKIIIDRLLELPAPHNPNDAVDDFSAILKQYNVFKVCGDRVGGNYTSSRFLKHGIFYDDSNCPTKTEIYIRFQAIAKTQRIELLDHKRLRVQAESLIRRVGRSIGESISHPEGGHDDLINAVGGASFLVAEDMVHDYSPAEMEAMLPKLGGEPRSKTVRDEAIKERQEEREMIERLRAKGVDV